MCVCVVDGAREREGVGILLRIISIQWNLFDLCINNKGKRRKKDGKRKSSVKINTGAKVAPVW